MAKNTKASDTASSAADEKKNATGKSRTRQRNRLSPLPPSRGRLIVEGWTTTDVFFRSGGSASLMGPSLGKAFKKRLQSNAGPGGPAEKSTEDGTQGESQDDEVPSPGRL